MKILPFLALAPASLVFLGAEGGLSAEAAPRERRVPAEYPTIQAAIDAAVDGDTVRVAAGVYGESIRWQGKRIALIGAGASATILDPGAGAGGRCLTLENVPAPAEVRGLACRNGSADTGGGILIRGGSPALRSLTLQSNTATAGPGGGVRVDQGSVTVEDCSFLDNRAPEVDPPAHAPPPNGGGLYAGPSSHVTVSASSFARNSALRGGGMSIEEGTEAVVRRATFEDNTGGLHVGDAGSVDVAESAFLRNRRGGGLHAPFSGVVNVSDTLFESNVSDLRGGGMYARLGEARVTRSVFRDNTSALGGGLALTESGLTLTDSSFIGNHATENGGGLGFIIGGARIERTRFLDNEAAASGGGVYVASDSHTSVESTVFRGNRAGADGGGMAARSVIDVSWENCAFSDNLAGTLGGAVNINVFHGVAAMVGSTLTRNAAGEHGGGIAVRDGDLMSILNTILWENRPDQLWFDESIPPTSTSVTYTDVQGGFPGEGNIDADPLFLDAARGDLRLRPGSPARDAGFDNGELSPTDLAGNPRVHGPAPEMGAYEFSPPGRSRGRGAQ